MVPHYGTGQGVTKEAFCGLHGWQERKTRPVVVDAVLVSTELDMLEIRWKEYKPFVDLFVVVESNMTFAGTPKRKYFAEQWTDRPNRFDFIPREKIVYLSVDDLEPNLPVGSFQNEAAMRQHITQLLHTQASEGKIPTGSLILHSDVDEIISRDTLALLTTCQSYPSPLHLNVKNYRYGFAFPLPDAGYWRPKVITHDPTSTWDTLAYGHGRAADVMLEDAGWHCSWCFRTLEEMRIKMLGYSHNDRVRNRKDLLDPVKLRQRVCEGAEPFGMLPVRPHQFLVSHSTDPRRRKHTHSETSSNRRARSPHHGRSATFQSRSSRIPSGLRICWMMGVAGPRGTSEARKWKRHEERAMFPGTNPGEASATDRQSRQKGFTAIQIPRKIRTSA